MLWNKWVSYAWQIIKADTIVKNSKTRDQPGTWASRIGYGAKVSYPGVGRVLKD